MGTVFNEPADLKDAIGKHLGYSEWLEVTQERIDTFADATGDHQWIHVDPERAKSGPFGATIAHGYLTLSLVSMFLPQMIRVENISMGVNYGCNKVRFPAPVPVGSKIRGRSRARGRPRASRTSASRYRTRRRLCSRATDSKRRRASS